MLKTHRILIISVQLTIIYAIVVICTYSIKVMEILYDSVRPVQ